MQRILLTLLGTLFLFSACERNEEQLLSPTAEIGDPMTKSELNAEVARVLFATDEAYDWARASDRMVWSALELSEHEAVLGYQPAGYPNLAATIHEIDVTSSEWEQTRNALVAELRDLTEVALKRAVTDEELFHNTEDGVLPILEVRILAPEVLLAFRNRPDVRYLEPSNYTAAEVELRSGAGCSEAPASIIATADLSRYAGANVPWNFAYSNITQAWGTSQGSGIGICIIDSGTYPEQRKLGSEFSTGSSAGRFIQRYGTYAPNWWSRRTDGPNDDCGHGTQMSGLAAAPLTGSGTTAGAAWRANLVSVRATSDVIINSSREKRGVKDALVLAGNRSDIKVISMSLGDVFSSGTVKDGVRYAYNRGKLVLAAAGTSTSWLNWYGVIFPASMSETTAVTGIETGSPMKRCDNCHDGSKVDFAIVMQRRSDGDRTSVTLARSGNTPGYVGGSSAATATTAGIAALVWATNPGQSREQVVDRLKRASSFYPGRDGDFGWGLIDAAAAVR